MRDVSVVTCFLLRRDEEGDSVLLLRRSHQVSTYRGRWAAVSGYLETPDPREQAYREIREEAGLGRDDVRLLAQEGPFTVPDESIGTRWAVHLFLFQVLRPQRLRLDWEHTESRWVKPEQLSSFATVPGLAEGFARVYPGP